MKKIFISVALVLIALTSAMADGAGLPISLVKKPKPHDPVPVPGQGIDPLSLTADENFLTIEASLTDDVLSLTASSATFAQVIIEDEFGAVVYSQLEVLGSVPTQIYTADWASGSYTLYITIGDDLYEGFFLL